MTSIGQKRALADLVLVDGRPARPEDPVRWQIEEPGIAVAEGDSLIARGYVKPAGETNLFAVLACDPTKSTSLKVRFQLGIIGFSIDPAFASIELTKIGGEPYALSPGLTIRLNTEKAMTDLANQIIWKSEDPRIAIVDADNNLIAKARGATRIEGTTAVDQRWSVSLMVTVNPPSDRVFLSPLLLTLDARPAQGDADPGFATAGKFEAKIDGLGQHSFAWSSSDTSLVTVDELGYVSSVRGAGTGSVVVTATALDDARVVGTASALVVHRSGVDVEVK